MPEDNEELEDAIDLPDREAMSLIDPTSLLGGGGLPLGGTQGSPSTPTSAPTGGGVPMAPSAPAPPIALPHLPNLPQANPGGTYSPDTSASNTTPG